MVASTAGRTVRSTDLVGRLGGEEFIVLLPCTSVEAARRLAEKLRNQLQNAPTLWEKTRIPATASIGVSGTTANDNHDFDTLYREADKALYVAKTQGRNRVV
jgi:diguanylate cyclase (GGDEF)-like protein